MPEVIETYIFNRDSFIMLKMAIDKIKDELAAEKKKKRKKPCPK